MGKNRKKDIIYFIIMFIFATIGILYSVYLFINSFNEGKETKVFLSENSELKYKVKLLENNFYENEYLSEDYDLIAKSIDKIEGDFKYLFGLSDNFAGNFNRKIDAQIIAYQKGDTTKRKIWDYQENIGIEKIINIDNKTNQLIDNGTFEIDYQKYRIMMEEYKNKYGVSLSGDLIITISFDSDLNLDTFKNNVKLSNRKLSLTISLTDTIVNIKKDTIKQDSQTLIEKADSKINYTKLSLSLFTFILGLILCIIMGITIVKIIGIDSEYEKRIKKILKTYGSVIVEVKSIEANDNINVMYVSNFEELLDAQQELRKPILYCNLKNNVESLFAIKYDNDIIVYDMKAKIYEENKKKKKSGKNVGK